MMVSAGFDHKHDELGNPRTDHAASGEPTSFELADGTEVLYAPNDPEYHEVIERPRASSSIQAPPPGFD